MNDNRLTELLPKNIRSLQAYSSAKSEKLTGTTWLNANESPFSRSYDVQTNALNRYPDPQPENVIKQYGQYTGLAQKQILMTRGADEGIELLVRTYCVPSEDSITIFTPTYGMYKVTANTHNIQLNEQSQTLLLKGTTNEIVKGIGSSKLIFICNPNNPTGSVVDTKKISAIAKKLKGKALLVIDEAYIEFCEEKSAINLLNDFTNIVILRTLSKAFALAGLRTGFMLASEELLNPVRKVIAPYPVSSIVAQIVAQALTVDAITQMRRQVSILNVAKEKLITWLKSNKQVCDILVGEGNFVTLKLNNKEDINKAYNQGLIMRPFNLYGSNSWLRISIGTEQELQHVKLWLNSIDV